MPLKVTKKSEMDLESATVLGKASSNSSRKVVPVGVTSDIDEFKASLDHGHCWRNLAIAFFVMVIIGVSTLFVLQPSTVSDPIAIDSDVTDNWVTIPVEIIPGEVTDVELPTSSTNELLLLKKYAIVSSDRRRRRKLEGSDDDDDEELEEVIIARSYDGEAWEAVGSEPIDPSCTVASCDISILDDGSGRWSFRIDRVALEESDTSIPHDEITRKEFARLLLQGTFGPRQVDIDNWINTHNSSDADQWIQAQMALPMTSFRQRWRERSTPRVLTGSNVKIPCEIGSRWHKYTFNYKDLRKKITISAHETEGYYNIRINGELRTQLTEWRGVPWTSAIRDDPSLNMMKCGYVQHRGNGLVVC